jgi:hypothetical protein
VFDRERYQWAQGKQNEHPNYHRPLAAVILLIVVRKTSVVILPLRVFSVPKIRRDAGSDVHEHGMPFRDPADAENDRCPNARVFHERRSRCADQGDGEGAAQQFKVSKLINFGV